MHTHFRTFSRKFFEKNSPFTYSHREGANSNPNSKNIFLFVKTSSLIWNWNAKTHPVFKKNLKKYFQKDFPS